MVPIVLWCVCVVDTLFLGIRWLYFAKGRSGFWFFAGFCFSSSSTGFRFGDHLDTKLRLFYWTLTFVCVASALNLTAVFSPPTLTTSPFVGWALLSAVMLGFYLRLMSTLTERVMAICGIVILVLAGSSVLVGSLKFDGYLTTTWSIALLPLYIFCCSPILIAPFACVAICLKGPTSCSRMFDCSRPDPSESVLVGTAATLFGLFVGFPLLFTVILLLPIADGSNRLFSVGLIPMYLDIFVLILIALKYVVKEIAKQRRQ